MLCCHLHVDYLIVSLSLSKYCDMWKKQAFGNQVTILLCWFRSIHLNSMSLKPAVCIKVGSLLLKSDVCTKRTQYESCIQSTKIHHLFLNPTIARCGSRIWSRGPQLLRLKVANIVEQSHMSEASYLWPWKWALEAFGF